MTELISPLDMQPDDVPSPDAAPEPLEGPDTGQDLDAVRELVLRANPDVVPELVTGATISDLIASVGPAREAFTRIATSIGEAHGPAPVPAGGGAPIAIDPDRMPAHEKIRRGLAAHAATKKG